MSKFKVGDRVKVYGGAECRDSLRKYYLRGESGEVVDVVAADEINVRLDEKRLLETATVHPKQCRRLKTREPRRIWVPKPDADIPDWSGGYVDTPKSLFGYLKTEPVGVGRDQFLEFVEVRRK